MPKLIIPNAYELYKIHQKPLTHKEAVNRLFYNFRFLWLLEPGDVILLQDLPNKEFINYLAEIKGFDPDTLIILSWNNTLNATFKNSLNDEELINRLKGIISSPLDWSIQTCYFNRDILKLADRLNIPVDPSWRKLVEDDFIRRISKNNTHFARNVSNWLHKKKVFPHNVIVFEEEHRLYLGNVVEMAVESSSRKNHSAIFPIELPSWFIFLFTKEGDIILDPFMGSGSTAVAA